MKTDKNILYLAELDTLKIEHKTFILQKELSGNSASSFMYSNKDNSDEKVFVKFLISPRSELELYKFNMESNILKLTNMKHIKTTPLLLKVGEHKELPIYFYVTEWIDGKTLKVLLSELNEPSLDSIINIVHRCTSSAAYMTMMISHRDFHPGNIIFLNDEPEWAEDPQSRESVDAKVIITDFGNAVMPMAFGYEDDGHGNEITFQNINRRIEGSFRSLPPEIFSDPINAFSYNQGCGEAWAIGILFYKLISGEDILNIESISEYSELVCSKTLKLEIESKISSIEYKLDNFILSSVLRGLLDVNSSSRMSLGVAAGLFWDYRFGDLNEKPMDFKIKYIRAGRSYPPILPHEHDCY